MSHAGALVYWNLVETDADALAQRWPPGQIRPPGRRGRYQALKLALQAYAAKVDGAISCQDDKIEVFYRAAADAARRTEWVFSFAMEPTEGKDPHVLQVPTIVDGGGISGNVFEQILRDYAAFARGCDLQELEVLTLPAVLQSLGAHLLMPKEAGVWLLPSDGWERWEAYARAIHESPVQPALKDGQLRMYPLSEDDVELAYDSLERDIRRRLDEVHKAGVRKLEHIKQGVVEVEAQLKRVQRLERGADDWVARLRELERDTEALLASTRALRDFQGGENG